MTVADTNAGLADPVAPDVGAAACSRSRFGTFAECPHCGGAMSPEHAHYRCSSCGWRDSCCD
jgi:hypothetical protein